MSKYVLFSLKKSKYLDKIKCYYRTVKYTKFSTNSPIFRKLFNILIKDVTIDYNSFKQFGKKLLKFKELKSEKLGMNGKWELVENSPTDIKIGVGGKRIKFGDFLLNEKNIFHLRRGDNKAHLFRDISVNFKQKFHPHAKVKKSELFLFRPPATFKEPKLVTLDFVEKTGNRQYCYIKFK